MNISIIHHPRSKRGLSLRPNAVRMADRSVLIDLGPTKLLFTRNTAAELAGQLLDQLVVSKRKAPQR